LIPKWGGTSYSHTIDGGKRTVREHGLLLDEEERRG